MKLLLYSRTTIIIIMNEDIIASKVDPMTDIIMIMATWTIDFAKRQDRGVHCIKATPATDFTELLHKRTLPPSNSAAINPTQVNPLDVAQQNEQEFIVEEILAQRRSTMRALYGSTVQQCFVKRRLFCNS
jgi:hypothetical protein